MANVPIYNQPTVADKHIAKKYNKVDITPDMLGASVYEAIEKTGQELGNLSLSIQKKTDEYNKTKIVELTNKIDSYTNTTLYDKDNGYFYKTGANAMGVAPQVMADYDNFTKELLKESGLKGEYQTMAQNAILAKRNNIFPAINKHDAEQTQNWQNAVYLEKEANFLNQAVLDRNDDVKLANTLKQGYNVIQLQAQLQNWDKETTELKKKDFASKYHQQVIQGLLADGSLRAKDYYEAHKEEISPDRHNSLLDAINGNELNYKANDNAQYMMSLPLTDAYKYLDNIKNIYERNETEKEFNRLINRKNEIIKQKDNEISQQFMNQFYDVLQNGSHEDIRNFMQQVYSSGASPEMQDKLLSKIKDYQEVGQYITNWGHKQFLEDIAFYNAEEFKTLNLAEYDLSKADYQHFADLQRKVGTEEFNNRNEYKKALEKINTNLFGMGTKNVPNSSFYKSDLFNIFNKIERMQGKAINLKDLDNGQIRNLIDAFNYKSEDIKDKSIDEFKELYIKGREYSEFYDVVANNYQRFKQMNKREPSPDEIYQMTLTSVLDLEKEKRQRANTKLVQGMNLFTDVNNVSQKKGETRVLTYFADYEVPRIANTLGLKLNYVEGSRYREGDIGGHGKGKKFDLSMSEHSSFNREAILREVLASPLVEKVGTSDSLLLEKFKGNPKIIDLRRWDKEKGSKKNVNHISHLDITLNTRFGGEEQGGQQKITMQRPDGKIVSVPVSKVSDLEKQYKYKRL